MPGPRHQGAKSGIGARGPSAAVDDSFARFILRFKAVATGPTGAACCVRKTASSLGDLLKRDSARRARGEEEYSRSDPVIFSCRWIVVSLACSIIH